MNTYTGTGGILGAALLPATSSLGLVLINHANPTVVIGLMIVNIVSFVTLLAQISRFAINTKTHK